MVAVACIAVLLVTGVHARQGEPVNRLVVATKVYSLVQRYFAHWEGVSREAVDEAYRQYVEEVVQATDRRAFTLATMKFVATLHNGHTQFFDDSFDNRPIKFRLLDVGKDWVVTSSQDGRLAPGSIVRTIDGQPVEAFVRDRAIYVAASNTRMALSHVFTTPGLFSDRVSLGLADGRVVSIDRSVPPDTPIAPLAASQGRWLREGEIAYVRIPSFGDPAFERTAIELVRQFAASPNLVIDVRFNGGGTTPRQLLDALMNCPWATWQETTPQLIALFEANGIPPIQMSRPSRVQQPARDAYSGRVFLLVDRFCVSACEDFVMPFKDTHRAIVIGETTQASSGNPARVELGDGMRLRVGAVRYRFPNGAPFEGVGIEPDVPVERTVEDLRSGVDRPLERAQELARRPR